MPEFSRRVDFHIFKDEPLSRDDWYESQDGVTPEGNFFEDDAAIKVAYAEYLANHQPFRWHAKSANRKIISDGESYFNEADCINAVELLGGDDTTAYYVRKYGKERPLQWLRYGKTDRDHQAQQ